MNSKLLLIISAAILTVCVGSVNAKPVHLTSTQLDKVVAGGAFISQIQENVMVNGKVVSESHGAGNSFSQVVDMEGQGAGNSFSNVFVIEGQGGWAIINQSNLLGI